MFRRECLRLGLLAGAALCGARRAGASQFVAVSLTELVRSSHHVWVGVPTESHAEWIETPVGKLIVTHTRVGCEREVLRGPGHAGELWVRTLGGSIGKLGQLVPGEARLALGERCLLFLARFEDRHVVNAMAQGHYPIRRVSGVERLSANGEALRARARRGSAVSLMVDRELSSAVSLIENEAP
jgi:hypothetical protein